MQPNKTLKRTQSSQTEPNQSTDIKNNYNNSNTNHYP